MRSPWRYVGVRGCPERRIFFPGAFGTGVGCEFPFPSVLVLVLVLVLLPPTHWASKGFQNRQFPSGKLHFSVTEALKTWAPCKFLKKWPLRATPKSTPQPPNFDDSFEKSIQRVFWQLSFLIYCLITFCANPPATVRFWDDSLRKTDAKRDTEMHPETAQAIGGER